MDNDEQGGDPPGDLPGDWAIRWTDDQLSMIASAIAGGQLLCCEHGEYTRETICTTRAQLEELAEWAHEGAGCAHIDLSRKNPGPHDASPYQARIDCYLRNFMGFDHASRQS